MGHYKVLPFLLPMILNNKDPQAKMSASEQILPLPAFLGKLVEVIGMQASAGWLDEPGPVQHNDSAVPMKLA